MTKLETKVEKLARELRKMRKEVENLRQVVMSFRATSQPLPFAAIDSKRTALDSALREAGLLVDKAELEREITKYWKPLSKEEREAIKAELRSLRLNVLVSDIIIENRC